MIGFHWGTREVGQPTPACIHRRRVILTAEEYYNGGLKIGQSTTSSNGYSVPFYVAAVPAGPNVFIARVVATTGQAVASAPLTVIVQ